MNDIMLCDFQAQELHTKHSAEAMKAEKWQFEYKNLHDKYDALLKEKEVSQRSVEGCRNESSHLEVNRQLCRLEADGFW